MIMNPVIQGGAAPEKVYKITDETYGSGLPQTAPAGEFITTPLLLGGKDGYILKTAGGVVVPTE